MFKQGGYSMKQLIARISDTSEDVDIAVMEGNSEPFFKKIKCTEFVNIVNRNFNLHSRDYTKDLKLLDPQIIALNEHFVVIRQEEHKKIVTYLNTLATYESEILTYKINFPNAIYIVEMNDRKIRGIECYAYKEFKGENTQLFEYPMPNELSGNRMCIGNADRTINDGNVVEALERIVFTPYSHTTFSGMNGFSQTKAYFEYLEKNEFPYKMMKSLRKKLKDVLKG